MRADPGPAIGALLRVRCPARGALSPCERRDRRDLGCLTVPRSLRIIWVCRRSDKPRKEPPVMRTFVASAKSVDSRWHVIDAEEQVLGRIATLAARLLQGKHKPTYTPFIDTGDHVVIVNAERVKLTGAKEEQKLYRRHSGYEGGLREERAKIVRQLKPARLVEEAVRGMLPKTKIGDAMYGKLKVYAGPAHPHAAQKPTKIEVA